MKKKSIFRAAIYVRVSTKYQEDKESLPVQIDALKRKAKVMGIDEVVIFKEVASAKDMKHRPHLLEMMKMVDSGYFTHVLVYKLDRISRSVLDFAMLYDKLKKKGVYFISLQENFNTNGIYAEVFSKLLMTFAEFERMQISERVKSNMFYRAKQGLWHGGTLPYGYLWNEKKDTILINEGQADIVRMIFDLYYEYRSLADVCEKLKEKGVKNEKGEDFLLARLDYILKNPMYTGVYRYKVKNVEAKDTNDRYLTSSIENHHIAIISKTKFEECNRILRENNFNGKFKENAHTYIFSGKVFCHLCGRKFVGTRYATVDQKQHYGYRCTGASSKVCSARRLSEDVLFEQLLKILQDLFAHKIDNAEEISQKLDEYGLNGLTKTESMELLQLQELYTQNKTAILRLDSINSIDNELQKKKNLIIEENQMIMQRMQFLQFTKKIDAPVNRYQTFITEKPRLEQWLFKFSREEMYLFIDEFIDKLMIKDGKIIMVKFRNGMELNMEVGI